jgi:polyhydroxyalkanoate synthesis regulator phasin
VGKRKWLLAAGGAVVAGIVGIGAVAAQDGGDTTGMSFLDRVAQKLGVDTPRLEQAIEEARNEEIDERVADGDLTQEQADRLKERLDALPSEALGGGFGRRGGGEFAFKFREAGPGFAICAGVDTESLSEFLGISPDQLREELRAEGATLATVAEAHGKTRDELKAFIADEAKAKLDGAVAEGDLTQERADEILANLNERIDEMIDGEFPPFMKPGRFFRHGGPFDEGEDDATPEQEQGGELNPASRS